MKKLLIFITVLLFTVTAFAQVDPVAYIVGSETQASSTTHPIVAETILVQLSADLDEVTNGPIDWITVVGDFNVLDGTVVVPLTSAGPSSVGANFIELDFDETLYSYGPDVNDLKLHYVNFSGSPIYTEYGNLQNTSTAVNIDDGIDPILIEYTIASDHTNPYFATEGNVVTLTIVSNEALAAPPYAPVVTFTLPDVVADATVTATQGVDNLHWTAEYTIPTGDYDGAIGFAVTFYDVHANQNSLTNTTIGTDTYSVMLKGYDPDITYAGLSYDATTLPGPVFGDDDDIIWLWNVFNTIQDAVDAVAEGSPDADGMSYVSVAAGTYDETVTVDKSYLRIDGVQNNTLIDPADSTPGTKVVEILADHVYLFYFKIANTGGDQDYGILLGDGTTSVANNCLVNLNDIDGTFYGIGLLPNSYENSFSMNYVMNCYYGIVLVDANDNELNNNNVSDCNDGIVLENASVVSGSTSDGSTTNTITSNNVSNCANDGIYVGESCDSNTISENTIHQVTSVGIHIWRSGSQTITENETHTNNVGIRLHGSSNNDVQDNDVHDNTTGIELDRKWIEGVWYASESNTISGNKIFSNTTGIDASDNNNVTVEADQNYWGEISGPENATYNLQGLGNPVTDDVKFSHWWETADMLQETSSAYAIYYAMGNDEEIAGGTNVTMDNFASTTDGTITFDIATDYPEFNVNLPHELKIDALLDISPTPPEGAIITVTHAYGSMTYTFGSGDDGKVWVSEFTGAVDRPYLYLDIDWGGTVTLENMDSEEYTFTIATITSEGFASQTISDYDADIINSGVETNYDLTFYNYYRDYAGNGFVLDSETETIQDPVQYVLDNSSFVYNDDLAIDVLDEMTFSYTATYPNAPTTPALNGNWLWDIKFVVSDNLPINTVIEWDEETLALDLSGANEFWLSELLAGSTPFGQNVFVDELVGGTRDFSFTLTGLDDSIYNLDASLIISDFADVSQDEYTIGEDDFYFQDPIQVAAEQTVVTLENLENSTDGYVSFDIDVDYPDWTTIPELPTDLKVDAIIGDALHVPGDYELPHPLQAGVVVDVYYNSVFVDSYTTDGSQLVYLSEVLSLPSSRPSLKNDVDGVWTLHLKNLDADMHNLTFATCAAGTGYFPPFGSDDETGFYGLGWTMPHIITAPDITFQDPMQIALETTLVIDELEIDVEDVLAFNATVTYPTFTDIPAMSSDWLADAWLDLGIDTLPAGAVVDISYNGIPLVADVAVDGQTGFWVSEILTTGGVPSANVRTPLSGHNELVDVWGITLQGLDSSEYTLNMYSVAAAAANFVDPTLVETSLTQYVLAEDDITFQDPIEYAEDNSSVDIDIIEDINAEAGIQMDVDVQYATLPTNPYVPVAPEDELYVDALIICFDADENTVTYFPTGTSVDITRTVDDVPATWLDKTFPTGQVYVWLSDLLAPTAYPNYRNLLSSVDGDLEEWHFDIDGMDYDNYGFGVAIVTAVNPLGFEECASLIHSGPADNENWLEHPWYSLGADTVFNIQIPYFEALDIEVSEDALNWDAPYASSWDDEAFEFDATLEMDVDIDHYYLNLTNTVANTEIALGYHPFYIDTENYPDPHPLGFVGTDSGMTEHDYTFLEYWASRGVYEGCTGTWEPTMWNILNGTAPFFYIKVSEDLEYFSYQTFELIDGLQHQLGQDEYMQLPGDYFLGDYVFTGYIYSKSNNGEMPTDANGVDELRSDLITINITVQDIVDTTYPEFNPLELQDQVQNSDYWIDLEKDVVDADIFTMYLNDDLLNMSGEEYYELNIDNDEMMTNYDFAPQYQPFYLVSPESTDFWTYWNEKGVNASATTGWEAIMWNIISGNLPMFYIDVANDQTMSLIDGLLFAVGHLTETDAPLRINYDYPLDTYIVEGDLVGINGTMYENLPIFLEMLKSEVVDYDLTIWDDYTSQIQITEHEGLAEEDINMVVDEPYDITVNAVDVNKVVVSDYDDETILFGTNYDAYVQMTNWVPLQHGTVYLTNAIRSLHEINDPMLYITITGELFDSIISPNGGYIVEPAEINIAQPTCFTMADVVPDQGGFVFATICRSVNDPFHSAAVEPYIDHYTIERYSLAGGAPVDEGAWEWFESIDCFDNGSDTIVTGPLATIGSDDEYDYRVTAVYVPNSDVIEKKAERTKKGEALTERTTTKKEESPTDEGAQSDWVYSNGVAAADNIPAYADFTVYLEGAYINGGQMTDGTIKPLTSPYNGETLDALPLPNGDIIDWIWVELRETATGATLKECNAFLLPDGSIVDVEGGYSLPFYYTTDEDYYIVLRHRNHLAIMSSTTHQFSDNPDADNVIDLSASGSVYGDGFVEVESGVYGMYTGDANNSDVVNVNDAFMIIDDLGQDGYIGSDLNISGVTNVNDAFLFIDNMGTGSTVPAQTDNIGKNEITQTKSSSRVGEECTLEITNVTQNGTTYSYDVYITRNTSNWNSLGSLDFLGTMLYSEISFDYNNNALNNITLSNVNPILSATNVTAYTDHFIIELQENTGSSNVPNTPTLLLTVNMNIVDPLQNASVYWKANQTLIMDENSNDFTVDNGLLELVGNGDITLPVVLSSFTADYVAQFDHVELNWSTASEDGNQGWNLYRGENEDAMVNGEVMLLNQGLIPGAGTTTEPTYYDFIDDYALVSGQEYWYWLESVDLGGDVCIFDPVTMTMPVSTTPELPSVTMLKGNYPNPFNPVTEIAYSIKQGETGVLSIYNAKGQKVHSTKLQAGNSSYSWEATEQASGIYFYRLKTDSYNEIKKMMLLK